MKTMILTTAIALILSFSLSAATNGTTEKSDTTKVRIFESNTGCVDVYIIKPGDEVVKIFIRGKSGTSLMKTRMKRNQHKRMLCYHLSELPAGEYAVEVEQNGKIISSLEIIR
ncbi:MAG: hypothetical protein PHW35_12030 [Lentimicrobiaceae bacterium]|jgi:hypothetical protein|nr:hypothetical protein [Lentimicrobiaceae bacterium]MDD4598686.1 hypothetical protein [Lentimicrobiaceae bacterium]MDY0027083.1 hypothetical protein [Lentimicrobium sp.]HAH57650.1 hypothetical protein [Bacteroidales bacterium]